jgi:hypothetical protein
MPVIRVPIGPDGPVDMRAHCQFVYDGLKGELLLVC